MKWIGFDSLFDEKRIKSNPLHRIYTKIFTKWVLRISTNHTRIANILHVGIHFVLQFYDQKSVDILVDEIICCTKTIVELIYFLDAAMNQWTWVLHILALSVVHPWSEFDEWLPAENSVVNTVFWQGTRLAENDRLVADSTT